MVSEYSNSKKPTSPSPTADTPHWDMPCYIWPTYVPITCMKHIHHLDRRTIRAASSQSRLGYRSPAGALSCVLWTHFLGYEETTLVL